jgi:hypothetical protein
MDNFPAKENLNRLGRDSSQGDSPCPFLYGFR